MNKKEEVYVPESLSREALDGTNPPRPLDIDRIPAPVHPSKRTRIANALTAISLVLIGFAVFLFLIWSFQSDKALVINNSPFPTRSVRTDAEPDGVVILTVDYCKNTDKQGDVRTSFVSQSNEVFLPVAKEQFDEGCHKLEVPIIIPKDLPADTYHMKFTVRYDINPLKQQVPVVFESQDFKVNVYGTDPNDPVITKE